MYKRQHLSWYLVDTNGKMKVGRCKDKEQASVVLEGDRAGDAAGRADLERS